MLWALRRRSAPFPSGQARRHSNSPCAARPGGEVPATIVGAGVIKGTPGNDVIVGSPGVDRIDGGPGDDIICGEGGNDDLSGGPGADTVIGDELDSAPFAPSNGNNDDRLSGGPGDDTLAGLETTLPRAGRATTS